MVVDRIWLDFPYEKVGENQAFNPTTKFILLYLSGGFIFFIFTSGKMIQFDEHIFHTGWFNHQLL